MASLTIPIAELGAELRRLPVRDREAVHRGLVTTARVDADRWIQWSIRGGGWDAGLPPPKPLSQKAPRKSKSKPLLRRPKEKLSKALRMFGRRNVERSRKPEPCERREPPAYRTPIDTGDYARSWRFRAEEDRIEVWSDASPPEKAGVIEEGRRPERIPIAPLAEWVRRKLGCTDPKKAIGIAFAISKAAAKQRREGLHVLARAHPRIAEAAARNVSRELRKTRPGT